VTRNRERLLHTLLVLGSVLFGLLALEIGLRVLRGGRGGKEGAEETQYTEHDPLLGWRKKAGARVTYRRREYTTEVAINSHGLRDLERGAEAPAGTFTVLALGDSFLEGYTVPLAQNVTQVLEGRLQQGGRKARVVNAGTAGYSTDQEYLFWQDEGFRYRPAVVVLFFYYNDIVYNERQDYFGTPKPALAMGGGRLCLHRYPVRRPAATAAREAEAEEPGSALLAWVKERLWYGAPRAHDALASLGLWQPIPKLPVRLELRVYERRRIPEIEDAWAKTDVILATLAREVEATGAHFLVAGIPSRLELDERTWKLTRQLYDVDDASWNRRQVLERLAASGRSGGFPVLDLSEALRKSSEPAYFTYDGHWTAAGHRVAAEQVAAFLAERGWLR
jgi:lysophospholipase L1-like esterase